MTSPRYNCLLGDQDNISDFVFNGIVVDFPFLSCLLECTYLGGKEGSMLCLLIGALLLIESMVYGSGQP